jgi:hypothetical protein
VDSSADNVNWLYVSLALAVAVVGAVAVAVVLLIRGRRALSSLRRNGPVVAFIGAQESGKTHYFAVMSYRMALGAGPGLSVVPRDMRVRSHLEEVYDQLINPKVSKPAGTAEDPGDLGAWSFVLRAKVQQKFEPLGEFRTSDYPGEDVQDLPQFSPTSGRQLDWINDLRGAEVSFGILDGARIRQLMDPLHKSNDDEYQFRKWLKQLLQILAENSRVVHLMVTKWDALATAGYDMVQLNRFLRENNSDFQQFVDARPSLRIIPVSSVGDNFYEAPDFEVRAHEFTLNPVNVEVPIALAFTEVIRHRLGGRPTPISGRPGQSARRPSLLDRVLGNLSVTFNFGLVGLQYAIKSDIEPSTIERGYSAPDSYHTIEQAYVAAYYHFESIVAKFDRATRLLRASQ